MPPAVQFCANDRDAFGNFPARDRQGKQQAAVSPELPAAYSPTLRSERSMNLPENSPMSWGLQLKSHGSLFKGGTE
jgi:hypothetical protein